MGTRKRLLAVAVLAAWLLGGSVAAQSVRVAPALDRVLTGAPAELGLAGAGLSSLLAPWEDRRPPDEELPPPWGWFVGPVAQVLNMPLDNLDPMTRDRKVSSFSDQTFLYGAMAGVIRKNLRLGIFYLTGNQRQTNLVNDKRRSAVIIFDGYGALLEYNRWQRTSRGYEYPERVPYVRYGALLGIIGGTGELKLRATGLDLGPKREWSLTATPLFVYPYLGLWVAPYDWLWLQFDMGYSFFILDTGRKEFRNYGKRMVEGNFPGGPHVGIKVFFGNNPNFELHPF